MDIHTSTSSSEAELIDLVNYWQNLISEFETRNADSVLPEMRKALRLSELCLAELTAERG